jgi:hypothetical protein
VATAYAAALAVFAVAVAAARFAPGGLAHRPDLLTTAAITLFCLALYVVAGGLVVALAAQRLAYWCGSSAVRLARAPWLRIVLWPITVGSLLLTAALAPVG